MTEKFVYLDYAASAPVRPEAFAAQQAYRESEIEGANPNSLHTLGRRAAQALDGARQDLVRCVGGGFRPSDVVFTSGGTESNNLAIYGIAEGARERDRNRRRVIVSAIEHYSVLDLVAPLRDRGFDVDVVRPRRDGVIYPEDLEALLGRDVALVSVMSANNETGVVQPVDQLCKVAHAAGALFHTDAVQAFARIPLKVDEADAVSVAGHKIGAPVGIGALLVRARCPFRPQAFGGGQEGGRRPGTQDVCAALTFAAVSKLVCSQMPEVREEVAERANHVYARLCADGTGVVPTTQARVDDSRLPGMVSVMVRNHDSESLVLRLDAAGFEVSAGSACSSASLDPSHVLSAMGIERNLAFGALRISFDERVGMTELDAFCDELLRLAGD